MTTEVITAIGAFGAFIAAVIGLGALVWEVGLDHKRRRRQATIETWVDLAPRRREFRDNLVADLTHATPMSSQDANLLDADTEKATVMRAWLGDLEYVALGVNTGVFDFHMLDRMSGSYFIRSYLYAETYVEHRRGIGAPTVFEELETLARRLWVERVANNTTPILQKVPDWA